MIAVLPATRAPAPDTTTEPAILAQGVRKRYAGRSAAPALDGFDLRVEPGTVHGLLGPNGAGKTTAVRVMATLLRFDAGRVRVAGRDVATQPREVRSRIGLTGQYAALDEVLTGRQNLEMFARLHHLTARAARRRAGELLERFDLVAAAGRPVRHYSGGMRRRLDLAASLIRSPRVLFLDEPTTGLDPRSRGAMWQAVRDLAATGTTVLLTTQYLEEADQLAGRVSVLDGGRVVAEGSPSQLKARVGAGRVEVVLPHTAQLPAAAEALARVSDRVPETDADARRVSVRVRDGGRALAAAVRALDEAGLVAEDIALRRPSLDDVFLSLTGPAGHRADEGSRDR